MDSTLSSIRRAEHADSWPLGPHSGDHTATRQKQSGLQGGQREQHVRSHHQLLTAELALELRDGRQRVIRFVDWSDATKIEVAHSDFLPPPHQRPHKPVADRRTADVCSAFGSSSGIDHRTICEHPMQEPYQGRVSVTMRVKDAKQNGRCRVLSRGLYQCGKINASSMPPSSAMRSLMQLRDAKHELIGGDASDVISMLRHLPNTTPSRVRHRRQLALFISVQWKQEGTVVSPSWGLVRETEAPQQLLNGKAASESGAVELNAQLYQVAGGRAHGTKQEHDFCFTQSIKKGTGVGKPTQLHEGQLVASAYTKQCAALDCAGEIKAAAPKIRFSGSSQSRNWRMIERQPPVAFEQCCPVSAMLTRAGWDCLNNEHSSAVELQSGRTPRRLRGVAGKQVSRRRRRKAVQALISRQRL